MEMEKTSMEMKEMEKNKRVNHFCNRFILKSSVMDPARFEIYNNEFDELSSEYIKREIKFYHLIRRIKQRDLDRKEMMRENHLTAYFPKKTTSHKKKSCESYLKRVKKVPKFFNKFDRPPFLIRREEKMKEDFLCQAVQSMQLNSVSSVAKGAGESSMKCTKDDVINQFVKLKMNE